MSRASVRRIEGNGLFSGCRRSELNLIAQQGTTVTLQPGRVLCKEGRPGSQFFVLVDGLVQVRGSRGTLALLHGGGWFGETALIRNRTREATVTTVVESTVIVYNRREFNTMRDVVPRVRERLDGTAALYVRGDRPTHPWYQSIDHPARVTPAPVTTADNGVTS
jgi:CRP-like cAMP-binding protein